MGSPVKGSFRHLCDCNASEGRRNWEAPAQKKGAYQISNFFQKADFLSPNKINHLQTLNTRGQNLATVKCHATINVTASLNDAL